MPKLKGSKNKSITQVPQSKDKNLFKCVCCGKEKNQEKEFYKSNSFILKGNNQRMVICKDCCRDLYEYLVRKHDDCKTALYFACRLLDIYFDAVLYYAAEQQANNSGSSIFSIYLQKVNSLQQYAGLTFAESAPLNSDANANVFEAEIKLEMSEEDKRNKEDVIRMVGYDPFENENEADKKYLYNTLIDFLDESTLEDSFKLPIVIEIVKSFNQIDKINRALALLTADISNMQNQTGGIKTLVESKEKIYRAVLAMAKDNGISINYSNNKSKGAGTLSGIIKKLQEMNLEAAEVNLFDIETAQGMKQVADISNKSILEQLMLDENDYTEMITDQRELIQKLDEKVMKLEEENRLLKIKLKQYESNG